MDPFAPDHWTELDVLFDGALQRPPDERTAWLRVRCGDDAALYHAVVALLDTGAEAEQVLGESATDFAAGLLEALGARTEGLAEEDLSEGTRVGAYQTEGELGRGGMGVVYRAARADGTFEKSVALKLVKRGMDTDEILRRFRYERQVLAGLDHPGIARLLDAGATDDGRPYLVLELVEGQTLSAYAEAAGLDLKARLALFEQVCEAVAYAHRHLVVHRDLKPSNILVADTDGAPQVKLLDFGVARLLEGELEEAPRTRPDQRILTPEYAAPEQLRGEAVTTATDVYALGVVLYELLAGQRPARPVGSPSAVASEAYRRALRGDLDTLVLKALHDEPARRYRSAEALLDDLRRYREGLPLEARPDSLAYRARKFVGRHRWGVGASVLGVLVLGVFLLSLTAQQERTAEARDSAATTAAFLESLFAAADPFHPERQDTLRVRDLLGPSLERVRAEFADQPETRAQLLHVIGETYLRLGLYPDAENPLAEAVALRREGASLAELAASLNAYAKALLEIGDAEASRQAAAEAGQLAATVDDSDLLARAERSEALALTALLRSEEAETVLRGSLERLAREYPDVDRPEVASSENALGHVLTNMGRIGEAESYYRSALDRYERLYGEEDPRRLAAIRDLSFVLLIARRYDEAEAMGAEAVAITRATRPGSGSLANILSVYGAILRRQGNLEAAEAALREATTLPPRRPADRAVPFGTLASVLHQKGDLDGAIAAQREALGVLRAARDESDPSLVFSAVKLAGFLRDAGRFEQAETLLLDLDTATTNASDGDPHGAPQVAAALATLYEAWGRSAEAERWRR